jgi:hypothetical protein
LNFRPGRRLRILVRRPCFTSSFPVQLGLRVAGSCGVAARARAVVRRDDGPGRWCWWSAWRGRTVGCRGGSPEDYLCWVHRDLVSCGRRGCLDACRRCRVAQLFWRIGFFIFVGASRVCFSHSMHGVFSPALVGGRLVLVACVLGGPCPVVSILARFLVN